MKLQKLFLDVLDRIMPLLNFSYGIQNLETTHWSTSVFQTTEKYEMKLHFLRFPNEWNMRRKGV